MSFVPRDEYNWSLLTGLAMSYMPLFNMQQGVARPVERLLARTAANIMSPEKFVSFFETKGMRRFDGFFLSFSGGTQGTQVVGQVLSKIMIFERTCPTTCVPCVPPEKDRKNPSNLRIPLVSKKLTNFSGDIIFAAVRASNRSTGRATPCCILKSGI